MTIPSHHLQEACVHNHQSHQPQFWQVKLDGTHDTCRLRLQLTSATFLPEPCISRNGRMLAEVLATSVARSRHRATVTVHNTYIDAFPTMSDYRSRPKLQGNILTLSRCWQKGTFILLASSPRTNNYIRLLPMQSVLVGSVSIRPSMVHKRFHVSLPQCELATRDRTYA